MGFISQIIDRFGRRMNGQPDPVRLSSAAFADRLQDRQQFDNILGNITPAKLVSIFKQADNGEIGPQIELADLIEERDPHVQSLLQTRRLSVLGLNWVISAGSDASSETIATEFQRVWDGLNTHALLAELLTALHRQWSIMQVLWNTNDVTTGTRRWTPIGFREVDARRMTWPQVDGPDVAVPALSRDWTSIDTMPIEPGVFVTHSFRDRRGRPGFGAPVRAIAFYWMCKRFAFTDWASLLEQFGRPWRAVKHDPKANESDIRKMLQVLKEAAADLCIAIPNNAELEFLSAAAGNDQAHERFVRSCNDEIAKAIIGNTTTADAAPNNDSVSSPTHAAVREDIRNADALALAETIRRDLIVPWAAWNFGNATAPKITPNLASDPDPKDRASVFESAGRLGLRVNSDQVYRELGLEKPEDVPEVISLQSTMGSFGMDALDTPSITGTDKPADPHLPADAVTQEQVLNGAQIQAAIDIVKSVARGEMPRDAGVAQLQIMFNLGADKAEAIMGSSGASFKVTSPLTGVAG